MKQHTPSFWACLVATLVTISSTLGQNLPSVESGLGNVFSQQPASQWPPPPPSYDVDERIPTPNQWTGGTIVHGWVTDRITDGTGTVLAGSSTTSVGPTTLKLPSFIPTDGSGAALPGQGVQLASVAMGAALNGRQATVFFGQAIARPVVDESGQPVSEQVYLPEPANAATGRFYFSPHARAVFATQSGLVDVVWRFRDPTHVPATLTLQYVVSSAPVQPLRRVFWTEKGFTGPLAQVPAGPISAVNVIYNGFFPPTVATEYDSPFDVPGDPSLSLPQERRTLWFTQQDRAFHAYNAEGRVFVEYLGGVRNDGVTRAWIGSDIIEVIREVAPRTVLAHVGDRMLPHDGDATLEASVVNGLSSVPAFLHPHPRPSLQTIEHYCIRSTNQSSEEPNLPTGEVLAYWLQKGNYGIKWPKFFETYIVTWPQPIEAYSVYARQPNGDGDSPATAVSIDLDDQPVLVYQDDPLAQQAFMKDGLKFFANLTAEDPDSRSLIRHTNGEAIWFERVHSTLHDQSLVSLAPTTVEIGARIEAPAGFEPLLGYIRQASGTAFDATAYRDPFVVGITDSKKGAIIPVNALDGHDQLEVWWFKKNSPPAGTPFKPTYWPAAVGRYTLVWPAAPAEIILASNRGTGELPSDQAAGRIYVQNDRRSLGFNPNEEHAMMIGGRAWALRDDLSTPTSSEPFVLLRYTANEDSRPAIRPFRVRREAPEQGILFDYIAEAGKVLQAPMPLPILPVPMKDNRSVNLETLDDRTDPAPDTGSPAHYDRFTFQDRKGTYWVYRGPHDEATPTSTASFSMKYYYTTMDSFFFPQEQVTVAVGPTAPIDVQPRVGTIVPYLRSFANAANAEDGFIGDAADADPIKVTFRPVWPESAPQLRLAETLTMPKVGLPAVRGNTSLDILYQQSLAADHELPSAILFDPTRAKKFPLSDDGLDVLPASINKSTYRGKIYFPNLPPHLSQRFYLNPDEGEMGTLVLLGEFKDEVLGEDYLLLNVLSSQDVTALKDLCNASDSKRGDWDDAIDGLETTLQTFEENPQVRGTYIPVKNSVADAAWDWLNTFKYVEKKTRRSGGWTKRWSSTFRRYVYSYVVPSMITSYYYYVPTREQFFNGVSNGGVQPSRLAAAWQWAQDNASKMQRYHKQKVDLVPSFLTNTEALLLKAALREDCSGETIVGPEDLAEVKDSDVAADSYALNASGGGTGYIVLIAGNGRAFTPEDEPVALHVIKVTDPLYRGEMKPIEAPNPLAEKLTMQHTGDFGGHPEDYEFEWRYAPPVDGAPPVLYTFERSLEVGNGDWQHTPAAGTPTTVSLPAGVVINNGLGNAGQPHSVLERTFTVSDNPFRLFLSLELGANDGVRAFLNEAEVVVYNIPGVSSSAQTRAPLPGFNALPLLFEVPVGAINDGSNTLRLELTTTTDPGVAPPSYINARLEAMIETQHLDSWISAGVGAGEAPGDKPGSVIGKSRHVIQGTGIFTLTDNYFIVRYRAIDPDHAAYDTAGGWSKWTDPALAEGWIKRALKGINPFEQRIKDLYSNSVNTDVSLLTQAGKRWEGDISQSRKHQ
jgi:hypothetical protein